MIKHLFIGMKGTVFIDVRGTGVYNCEVLVSLMVAHHVTHYLGECSDLDQMNLVINYWYSS